MSESQNIHDRDGVFTDASEYTSESSDNTVDLLKEFGISSTGTIGFILFGMFWISSEIMSNFMFDIVGSYFVYVFTFFLFFFILFGAIHLINKKRGVKRNILAFFFRISCFCTLLCTVVFLLQLVPIKSKAIEQYGNIEGLNSNKQVIYIYAPPSGIMQEITEQEFKELGK